MLMHQSDLIHVVARTPISIPIFLPVSSGGPSQLVADFDLGEDNSAWVVDVVGRLWFMTGVTASKPQGDGQWWQVSREIIL